MPLLGQGDFVLVGSAWGEEVLGHGASGIIRFWCEVVLVGADGGVRSRYERRLFVE